MLQDLDHTLVSRELIRIANPPRVRVALMDLGASLEEAIETADFLGDSQDDADAMLALPFAETQGFTPGATRFSNGSWRVFYSALETATAEAEKGYWCAKSLLGTPPAVRRLHFRELRCRLNGLVIDLRPAIGNHPCLTDGNSDAYAECQQIALEARELDVSALFCPSARAPGGTTVPVFTRQSLSAPSIRGVVVFEIAPDGSWGVIRP